MNNADIVRVIISTLEELRGSKYIPNPSTRYITSTGNLAFNSFVYTTSPRAVHIVFDTGIAPYIPYTNEKWISPRWNGKKNPNEGWFDSFADKLAKRIASQLNAKVIR